jgi:hypothetical protein
VCMNKNSLQRPRFPSRLLPSRPLRCPSVLPQLRLPSPRGPLCGLIAACLATATLTACVQSAAKVELPPLPAGVSEIQAPALRRGQDARVALAECRSALAQANAVLRSVDQFYADLVTRYGG